MKKQYKSKPTPVSFWKPVIIKPRTNFKSKSPTSLKPLYSPLYKSPSHSFSFKSKTSPKIPSYITPKTYVPIKNRILSPPKFAIKSQKIMKKHLKIKEAKPIYERPPQKENDWKRKLYSKSKTEMKLEMKEAEDEEKKLKKEKKLLKKEENKTEYNFPSQEEIFDESSIDDELFNEKYDILIDADLIDRDSILEEEF